MQPQTPASLDAGEYVAKGTDEEFGVETLIRAAAAAGASLDMCNVVTYRNNLNKWVLQPHVSTVQQDGRDGTAWHVDKPRRWCSWVGTSSFVRAPASSLANAPLAPSSQDFWPTI